MARGRSRENDHAGRPDVQPMRQKERPLVSGDPAGGEKPRDDRSFAAIPSKGVAGGRHRDACGLVEDEKV
jgi:hypothetical protein